MCSSLLDAMRAAALHGWEHRKELPSATKKAIWQRGNPVRAHPIAGKNNMRMAAGQPATKAMRATAKGAATHSHGRGSNRTTSCASFRETAPRQVLRGVILLHGVGKHKEELIVGKTSHVLLETELANAFNARPFFF